MPNAFRDRNGSGKMWLMYLEVSNHQEKNGWVFWGEKNWRKNTADNFRGNKLTRKKCLMYFEFKKQQISYK